MSRVQEFTAENFTRLEPPISGDPVPMGGYVEFFTADPDNAIKDQRQAPTRRLYIDWQDGPVNEAGGENGVFVETVIAATIQRIQFYQAVGGGRFACRENALAITKLEEALMWLGARTARREAEGTEGTHAGN